MSSALAIDRVSQEGPSRGLYARGEKYCPRCVIQERVREREVGFVCVKIWIRIRIVFSCRERAAPRWRKSPVILAWRARQYSYLWTWEGNILSSPIPRSRCHSPATLLSVSAPHPHHAERMRGKVHIYLQFYQKQYFREELSAEFHQFH